MALAAFSDEYEFKPRGRTSAPEPVSIGSSGRNKHGFDGLFEFQTAIFESMGQANRRLFDRMSSEGVLMTEFAKN